MENFIIFKIKGYDKNFVCLEGYNNFFNKIGLFGYADLVDGLSPLSPSNYLSTFELTPWKEEIEIIGDVRVDGSFILLRNEKITREHNLNLEIVPDIELEKAV